MARIVTDSDNFKIKASLYPAKSPVLKRDGWKVMVYRQYVSNCPWHEVAYSGVSGWFSSYDKALRAACDHLDRIERHAAKVKERRVVGRDVEDCNF
jgi:hypothetical protein